METTKNPLLMLYFKLLLALNIPEKETVAEPQRYINVQFVIIS